MSAVTYGMERWGHMYTHEEIERACRMMGSMWKYTEEDMIEALSDEWFWQESEEALDHFVD